MNPENLQHFHFLRPAFLLLLIPFALLIYSNWSRSEKQQRWIKQLPEHIAPVLMVNESGWSKQLPLKLLLATCIAVIFLLAGPSWYKESSPFDEDKSDLIIVLDASESMLEQDITPSRLSMSKFKIIDLLEERSGGQTGLIVYAGSAHTAMPLTRDTQVFTPLLKAINPKVMPREGKFAQYTLPLIAQMSQQKNTTVLLITDGINNTGLEAYRSYFSKSEHQLIIWGMGNDKRPSSLAYEESSLKKLASETGGRFVSFDIENGDVKTVSRNIESNMLTNSDSVTPWTDAGYYITFIVAAFYLFWFRKGWLVKWCLVGTTLIMSASPTDVMAGEWKFMDLWLTADQQGQLLFEKQEYTAAAEQFESDKWKAISYYMAEEYQLAQQYFMRTDSVESQFGAAAALANQREYVAAKKMYQIIVDREPNFPGAKENLALLTNIIEQIDQFSKSQSDNTERQSSKELGDNPQTSEGAEVEVDQAQLQSESFTAEELMNDPDLNEKWMRRVGSDLEKLLKSKFYFQLEDGNATEEFNPNE